MAKHRHNYYGSFPMFFLCFSYRSPIGAPLEPLRKSHFLDCKNNLWDARTWWPFKQKQKIAQLPTKKSQVH